MSNRSFPADFSRPLREVPVATDADVQRMLERLRRRCKVSKVSVNVSSPEKSGQPNIVIDGEVNRLPPAAVANLAPASSAGLSLPAGASVVSGAAGITATAGGGYNGAEHTAGFPFQPTRPAPISNGPGSGYEVDADASIASSVPALIWERVSQTAMRTTCGTWTCCKITIDGKVTYELWRRIAGLERPLRAMKTWSTFDEAKEFAQDEMIEYP